MDSSQGRLEGHRYPVDKILKPTFKIQDSRFKIQGRIEAHRSLLDEILSVHNQVKSELVNRFYWQVVLAYPSRDFQSIPLNQPEKDINMLNECIAMPLCTQEFRDKDQWMSL